MRYVYEGEIVNRVHSALNGRSVIPFSIPILGHYATAALWTFADMTTDWNGDEENAWERVPELQKAWEATLPFSTNQNEDEMAAETAYHNALDTVVDFENKIWLAILVSNAINALEGSPVNAWNDEDWKKKLDEEFKKDYETIRAFALLELKSDPILSKALES